MDPIVEKGTGGYIKLYLDVLKFKKPKHPKAVFHANYKIVFCPSSCMPYIQNREKGKRGPEKKSYDVEMYFLIIMI